jgi:AmmeMemoRadiSam system protein B
MNAILFAVALLFFFCASAILKPRYAYAAKVRRPAVAGSFYPGSNRELTAMVDKYLADAEKKELQGELVALIAPHAGYVYSGHVAAYAYKQLQGKSIDTVVLIGPSHRYPVRGAAVYDSGAFQTPLGTVKIDEELAKELIKQERRITSAPEVHDDEHCLEVHLPFLQRVLQPKAEGVSERSEQFKIVPILMYDFSDANCKMLSQALSSCLNGKNALLVASTDLCHYPHYEEAKKADGIVVSAISQFDPDLLRKNTDEYMRKPIRNLHCMLCGTGAVITVMQAAKLLGANAVEILKYANSGDVPFGDKSQVVGYLAAAIYKKT